MAETTCRVLVVDDEPDVRRLLEMCFQLEGYEVRGASDGIEALEVLKSFEPVVIVCDIMMPHMDGLKLLSTLKSDPLRSAIPVVLLSAKAESLDVDVGMRAGAADYIAKPFVVESVVACVARLVQGAGSAIS